MLVDIEYWKDDATNKHCAIVYLNVWNAGMLTGVIGVAEKTKSSVIASFGAGFVSNTSFEDFFHMVVSMTQETTMSMIAH